MIKQPLFCLSLLLISSAGYSQSSSLLDSVFPANKATAQGVKGFMFNNTLSSFNNKSWGYAWDEANVFRAQLKHSDYTLRVGKGSQLYSIQTPIGEICPPQWRDHAWIDDTWLMTCYFNELDDTMEHVRNNYSSNLDWFKPFVHSCGMYGHQEPDKTNYALPKDWWAPLLSEHWDSVENSYSTVTLGFQSNGPSFPRGDILFYQKIRDLGDGAFEMTYMTYYFNTSFTPDENYTCHWSPWGGVRTSKLSEHISSNTDGTWKVENTFHGQPGHTIRAHKTGGWSVSAQANSTSNSYALGYVYGSENPSFAAKDYIHGYAANPNDANLDTLANERDFTVIAERMIMRLPPGKTFFNRMFFVLGERDSVIERCKVLEKDVEHKFLDYSQKKAKLKPIYLTNLDGQQVISDVGSRIAGYVFAEPVDDSKPLFLVKDNRTGKYHATCDPYMNKPKYAIPGTPYKGWRAYDGSTSIEKLIGFVMPLAKADSSHDYILLDSFLTDQTYFTKAGIYDENVMLVKSNATGVKRVGLNNGILFYPNPANNQVHFDFKSNTKPVLIEVLDLTGKVLLTQKFLKQKGSLKLDGVKPGVLLIKASLGQEVQVFKLVKQ